MMYPFLTLDDSTEIVHSQTLKSGNVKVYIEIFRSIRKSLDRLHS